MLDLRGLFEKTGERILLDQKLELTDLELSPSQAFCSPISVKGEICNRAGIVIIDAAAAFDFSAACDRCAAAVNRAFVIPIKHVLVTSLSNEDDGSYFLVEKMELDLEDLGPKFEHDPMFPDRVNVEFVEVIDQHTLKARIWERGSGETMACGTGTCAAVVAATLNGYCEKGKDIRVILKGGELKIHYTDERVLMTGKAEKVYDGVVEV